jgi:tetratricopeptide (TPR) repeat protein
MPTLAQVSHHRSRWALQGILTLLLFSPALVMCAQTAPGGPDPVMVAVNKARNEGRLLDAETILRNAIQSEQSKPNSPRLGNYLHLLASTVQMNGPSSELPSLWRQALEADRHALGPTDLRVANDLAAVAGSSFDAGDYAEIDRLMNEALEIVQLHASHLNTNRDIDDAGAAFAALGKLYAREHRLADAESMMLQMKKACDLAPPHPGVMLMCDMAPNLLADFYRSQGRAAEAAQQAISPPDFLPPEFSNLNKTAAQYEKDGLYVQAESAYRRAIAWLEVPANRKLSTGIVLGDNFVVGEYNLLGGALEKQGLKDEAEATYLQAISLQENLANAQNPPSAYGFNFEPLINLYRTQGRLHDIEPVINQALEIQLSILGDRSPRVAQTWIRLARVYQEEGKTDASRYAAAQQLFERALAVQQANMGPNNRQLIQTLIPYADLLRHMHRDSDAAAIDARVAAIRKLAEPQPQN